ncbi:NeuD/PglB/VioB family sugar acetyltransferase [Massilia aerilata]|uniref:NeuD/PglB/VioB family sugar acetyltransferase n=1 Tax=Massilia aerilata TaxID=453817 RepID=A0ABW0RWM4_9BURK
MKRYAIFGASGFGREVLPLMRHQLQAAEDSWDLVFVDDNAQVAFQNGHRVTSYMDWLKEPADARYVAIAVANSQAREEIALRCASDGVGFVDVKGQNVVTLDEISIGPGAVLCPFVTITSNVRIGKQFHANIYSYIAHDCIIGDFVTFAPGVHCNGNVVIEDHAYIGAGAIIRQGKPGDPLIIGAGAVVGMGAVVTRGVAPLTTVIGNPARPMQV